MATSPYCPDVYIQSVSKCNNSQNHETQFQDDFFHVIVSSFPTCLFWGCYSVCKTQQQPLIPSLDACWQSVTLIGVDQINQAKQLLPGMTGNHDFSNRSYGSCWTAWGCRLATPRYAVRGASRSPRSELPRPGRLEIAGWSFWLWTNG